MGPSADVRLRRALDFILEIDKLKQVERRTVLLDGRRRENSAEHSWHLALMAELLAEYADDPVDLPRLRLMLLVHDLVEIDAGDTFAYDREGHRDKAARERAAADRIFGIPPEPHGRRLRELWEEFEAGASAEARFAAVLDRLMPLLHNFHTQGGSWREHGIVKAQVVERNKVIAEGSKRLWEFARELIEAAVEQGYLRE